MKVLVVGSSHAGYEVTQTLLKETPEAEIHLYESGNTASFLGWGSYTYLEGISKDLDELHYATSDSYSSQGVQVHTNSTVTDVNPEAKTITIEGPEGTYEESYDKLFLSPGAYAFELPIEGADLNNILTFRGREDTAAVRERMNKTQKTVVVGGGYIGMEVAEQYAQAGIDTTVIDFLDTILPTYLDKEFTDVLQDHIFENGITFKGGEGVQSFEGDENGNVTKVITDKGEYDADTVIMAVGIKPNTGWLKGKLEMDDRGFIDVNDYMQSSDPDIFVAGDATKVPFAPAKDKRSIALASNARRQGVIAAKNIAAGENKYKMPEVAGTSGLALFDYKFANTGVKDVDAHTIGEEVASKYVEMQIRPDFMHDDSKIMMKIHYVEDTHRIVGAQLMSKEDITASANVLSVAILSDWKLEDLALADFFFYPGFNYTWNHLNILAQQALGETFGSDKQLF